MTAIRTSAGRVYALRNGAVARGSRHAAATRRLAAGHEKKSPPLGDTNTASVYSKVRAIPGVRS